MQSINIYERGIEYLSAVMSVYMENCAYFLIYIAGIIYILIAGNKRERTIFLPSAIFMLVTIYNPVVPLLLNKFFDVNSEFYRLLWITPVIILGGYLATKLLCNAKSKKEIGAIILVMLMVGIFGGNFAYKDGYVSFENIYQIPDELISISAIIHDDCDASYPKAFFEYDYNMQIRQYDPKMQLVIDREDYLRAVRESYPEDMIYNDDYPQYRILASLVRGQDVDGSAFVNALESTKTEYIVISKGNNMQEYLKECGLKKVAETDNHLIYKYDIKEPYIYELVDYSDAEHKFCIRRLK